MLNNRAANFSFFEITAVRLLLCIFNLRDFEKNPEGLLDVCCSFLYDSRWWLINTSFNENFYILQNTRSWVTFYLFIFALSFGFCEYDIGQEDP